MAAQMINFNGNSRLWPHLANQTSLNTGKREKKKKKAKQLPRRLRSQSHRTAKIHLKWVERVPNDHNLQNVVKLKTDTWSKECFQF